MSNPIVTFETNQGTIKAELFPDVAPNTVNNFISLVKRGFYDGLIFHRFKAETLKVQAWAAPVIPLKANLL